MGDRTYRRRHFTSRLSPHPSHLSLFPGFQLRRHVILRPLLLSTPYSLDISLRQFERGPPFGRGPQGLLHDGLAETCYFYAQNLPTFVTLLPCADLALALLLSFFSHENLPGVLSLLGVDQSITRCDGTFFDKNTLSTYAKGVLIANAAWAAWTTLALLSWCVAFLCLL